MNMLNAAMQMGRSFLVDDNRVSACKSDALDEILGRLDHEVGFKLKLGDGAEGFESRSAKSNIRNESAVHYVNLDAIDTGAFRFADLFTKSHEVGGEDGRSDVDQGR